MDPIADEPLENYLTALHMKWQDELAERARLHNKRLRKEQEERRMTPDDIERFRENQEFIRAAATSPAHMPPRRSPYTPEEEQEIKSIRARLLDGCETPDAGVMRRIRSQKERAQREARNKAEIRHRHEEEEENAPLERNAGIYRSNASQVQKQAEAEEARQRRQEEHWSKAEERLNEAREWYP
jgi:hypothetical protein